jgi:hypothetical protein
MTRKFTKEQFVELWNREDCDINWEEIADCAVSWGICSTPKTRQMSRVGNMVLRSAGLPSYWEEDEDEN